LLQVTKKEGKEMKKLLVSVFVVVLASAVFALSPVWGAEKNLSEDPEMTARILAFDPEDFTQDFDVFFAGYSLEEPVALLLDMKDGNSLPSKFWSEPLSHEEIVYAIRRLKDQFVNYREQLPFGPRALNVVNRNGKVLGYIFFGGLADVVMDRKKDGSMMVKVFNPVIQSWQGAWDVPSGGGPRNGAIGANGISTSVN
jgi:hypothetical protein